MNIFIRSHPIPAVRWKVCALKWKEASPYLVGKEKRTPDHLTSPSLQSSSSSPSSPGDDHHHPPYLKGVLKATHFLFRFGEIQQMH